MQWAIKYLKPFTYSVKNVNFGSYAGYNPWPKDGEGILAKSKPNPWIIKNTKDWRGYMLVAELHPVPSFHHP